jgi:hypothetical protein
MRREQLSYLGGRRSRAYLHGLCRDARYRTRRAAESLWATSGTLLLLIGATYLPLPCSFLGMDEKQAHDFLAIMWPTVAAAVALSVAVVLFALQSVAGSATVSLKELASRSGLLFAIYISVAALLSTGVALLPLAPSGAAGWAGLFATGLCTLAISFVPFLFASALGLTEPKRLERRRIDDLRLEASIWVARSVRGRLASRYLESASAAYGFTFQRWVPVRATDLAAIPPRREGRVKDVRLRRLMSLLSARSAGSSAAPIILASLDDQVMRARPLLFVAPDSATTKRIRRTFRLGRERVAPDHLVEAAAGLHDQALAAIRDSRPSGYEAIRDAQEELLLAFPTAWAQAGFVSDDDGSGFISRGPISAVRQNIYEQCIRAAAAEEREIGFKAAYLPMAIASRAAELGASGLVSEMLGVSGAIFESTARYESPHFGSIMHEGIVRYVLEFLDYGGYRGLRTVDTTPDAQERQATTARAAQNQLASMLRFAVQEDEGELLLRCLRHWSQTDQFWNSTSSSTEQTVAGLRDHRTGCFLALAAWAGIAVFENDNAAHADTLRVLAPWATWTPDVSPEALRVAGDLLSDWLSFNMPERVTYSVDAQGPLINYLAYSALSQQLTQQVRIAPTAWLRDHEQALTAAISRLAALASPWASSLAASLPATEAALLSEVRDAVAAYKANEEERLRSAEVPAEALVQFQHDLRTGWTEATTLTRWLKARGLQPRPPTPAPAAHLFAQELLPKDFFLNEHISGIDQVAADLGAAMARGERSAIAKKLEGAKPKKAAGDIRLSVESAAEELAQRGFNPVIFLPINWRLREVLGLPYGKGSGQLDGVDLDGAYLGDLGTVPVLALYELERIVVADPVRFLTLEAWTLEGFDLSVKAEHFDDAAAMKQCRTNKELMREPGRHTIKARAAKLQTYVWLKVSEGFAISVGDPKAGLSFAVPKAVRDAG